MQDTNLFIICSVSSSVAEPDPDLWDPYLFGRSGSGSISQKYGSGSFNHQAKIVKKTLIFCDFCMTFYHLFTLMRIRILFFTLMRIRFQFSTLMRMRIPIQLPKNDAETDPQDWSAD
jgi:hypothetical protein